jgi:predicted transcriptional regulator
MAPVATNLRLSDVTAAALRAAAERSGRSQQELLREAVERFLGLSPDDSARGRAVRAGTVEPPTPFRDVMPTVELPRKLTSWDLLDRDHDR